MKGLPTRRYTSPKGRATATAAGVGSTSLHTSESDDERSFLLASGDINGDVEPREVSMPALASASNLTAAASTSASASDGVGTADADICAICLDEYVDDELLRILPCKHEFHAACVDQWLITRKRYCPLCKTDVCPSESTPLV